jgi:hypothetical protein
MASPPSTVVVRVPHPIIGELPPGLRRRLKDKFAYGADFLPLAAGLTATQQVNIEADSDFAIVSAQAIVTSDDNLTLQTFSPFLVDFRDTGSGRTFFNAPRHFNTIFGTAEAPAYWWRMGYLKRLRASSTLSVTIQNLNAATDFNIRITLDGFKIFDIEESRDDS